MKGLKMPSLYANLPSQPNKCIKCSRLPKQFIKKSGEISLTRQNQKSHKNSSKVPKHRKHMCQKMAEVCLRVATGHELKKGLEIAPSS